MRTPLAVLACATAIPALAQYTYYYNDTLTSINTSNWNQNGTVSAGSGGLTSSNSNGGSLISKVTVPAPSTNYEVKTTLTLASSGGTYVSYLEASSNALSGPGTQGSYYAVELQNPTFSGSACTATLAVYKSVSGTVTLLSSSTVLCHNGTTVRAVYASSSQLVVYIDNVFSFWTVDTSVPAGMPGVGVRGAPSGNSISLVNLGPLETNSLPSPVNPQSIGTSSFPNRVDMQWQGATDTNGVGIGFYQILRNGAFLANVSSSPEFADATVTASTTYSYTITVFDFHMNYASTTFNVTTAPALAVDPRRVGVRPTGTYWGAMGENIDLMSGNVSYAVPLLKAQGRGGWTVPINLVYNSENWRQDPGPNSTVLTWNLGRDVGYGYGWKLLAGSLTPVFAGTTVIDHYLFTDSSGAEYRLNVNNSGVWSSVESIYVYYDSNAQKLYFRDGSFWVMGCTSAGTEQDAGSLYPTAMEDTNGNVVNITYYAGLGVTWTNSSARINTIEDVRAQATGPYPYTYVTYQFTYNTDAIPHLTSITNNIHTAEGYTFAYTGNQTFQSPFSPAVSYGTADLLSSVTISGVGFSYSFAYDTNDSGQLDQVTLPYGGHVRWAYTNFTYLGSRTQPEISTRYLSKDGVTETAYPIGRANESGTAYVHAYADLFDPGGVGEKVWWFGQDVHGNPAYVGLNWLYEGRQRVPTYIAQIDVQSTWAQDPAGNPYISQTLTTQDPNTSYQIQKQVTQTLDPYGNLAQMQVYDWGNLSAPARTYTNTYLTSSAYLSRFILNRLVSSTLTGQSTSTTLVHNTYDQNAVTDIPNAREHDSAYGTTFLTRGLVSTKTTPVDTYTMRYDIGGNVTSTVNSIGTVSASTTTTTNYAAPDSITANNLTGSMSYASFLGLTNETGPNGDSSVMAFDSFARPATSTSPYGATTTYSYSTTLPATVTATVNGRWTQTTLDGLGRQLTVVTGYGTAPPGTGGTKVSEVDYYYDSCACSPAGKLFKKSQPKVPGNTVYWTQYTYDGMGRTTSVILPNNPATSATWGTTAYVYQGNTVKSTDPAGNWKTFTVDAFGNLTSVLEPNPAGGTFATSYTYDILNHLTGVPTLRGSTAQPRTFNYTSGGVVGALLLSKTEPETGTTTYTYQAGGLLASKTDAKNQQTKYSYDSLGRTTQIRHYPPQGGQVGTVEDVCQEVNFYYDTNPFVSGYSAYAAGRMAAVEYQGANCTNASILVNGTASSPVNPNTFIEMYSYTQPGEKASKKFRVQRNVSGNTLYADLDSGYTYDNEGRMTGLTYPNAYDSFNNPITGNTYAYTFDSMGRPTRLNDSTTATDVISTATYGPAGELLTLNGPAYSESRSYNTLLQVTGVGGTGTYGISFSQTYAYAAGANNGKATSMTDAVSGETVTYTYDALNRLTQALSNSSSAPWGQSFSYDIFGNLTDKNVVAGSAPTWHGGSYATYPDANGNATVLPGANPLSLSYDIENRMVGTSGVYSGAQTLYQYGPGNTRLYQANWTWSNGTSTLGSETVYFYSVAGQKIGTFKLWTSSSPASMWFVQQNTEVWFGAKLIYTNGTAEVPDRVGSLGRYYPYGEDRPSGTGNPPNDQEKFATYTRDSATGLDYAMNRYYNSVSGSFMTPDPAAPGIVEDPGSWNLYAYVQGDPINYGDPEGLTKCGDLPISGGPFDGQTLSQVMQGTSDNDLFAQLIYHEGGAILNADLNNFDAYRQDLQGIGTAVLNQWDVDNGRLKVYQNGQAVCPLGQCLNRTLKNVIIAIAKDFTGFLFDSNGNMRQPDRGSIDAILNGDVLSGIPLIDNGSLIGSNCEGLVSSLATASHLLDGSEARYQPNGLTLLFWNRASPDSTTTFPGSVGYTGVRDDRSGGHTFWGLSSVPPPPRIRRRPRPRGPPVGPPVDQ